MLEKLPNASSMNHELIDLEPFEELFLEFEELWMYAKNAADFLPPSIREFTSAKSLNEPEVLLELAKIDTEHRIRSGLNSNYQFIQSLNQEAKKDLCQFELSIRNQLNHHFSQAEIESRYELIDTINETSSAPVGIMPGPQIGTHIDQFVIEKLIGSGAFAKVYQATDTRLGRKVAIKFLAIQMQSQEAMKARMLREAQAAATLNHPNIVKVFDWGTFDESNFIVSEYVEGKDLENYTSGKEIEISESVTLVRKAANALEHAHQQGVIHRDLKPANIMLDTQNEPKVLDFGLAILQSDNAKLTMAGDLIGTPAFMPPEQANGSGWQADPRSDIYSLGAILYRLVCKELPFSGNAQQVISKIANEPPIKPRKLNSRIDNDLQTILLKCLEKDPTDRYQSAEALANDLERYENGESIVARRAGCIGRTYKWAKRKPVSASMLAGLLLLTAFSIGIGSQLIVVNKQKQLAEQAEERSLKAEKKLANQLAIETADAAKMAWQQGDIETSIELYEKAIQRGHPDRQQVKLDQIRSIFALNKIEQVDEKLLSSSGLKDKRNTSQLVWKAELALRESSENGRAIELLTAAKEGDLELAEKQYVEGLLAKSTLTAIDCFRGALRENHFHFRARLRLIYCLITMGEFKTAEFESKLATSMYPNHADFRILTAIAQSFQNEMESAEQLITDSNSENKSEWIELCKFINRVQKEFVIFDWKAGYRAKAIKTTIAEWNKHYKLISDRGWALPPLVERELKKLPKILTKRTGFASGFGIFGKKTMHVDALRPIVEAHPEASLVAIYGLEVNNLQDQNIKTVKQLLPYHQRSPDEFYETTPIDITQESSRLMTMAMSRSFILERNRVIALESLCTNAIVEAMIRKKNFEENAKLFRRIAPQLDPKYFTKSPLRAFTIACLKFGDINMAEKFSEEWIIQTESRDAYHHRMICERRRGNWAKMADRCKKMLVDFPEDTKQTLPQLEYAEKKIKEILANVASDR